MRGANRRKVIDMEEEGEKKNFEIVGDSKKKVVKFGAKKTTPLKEEEAPSKEEILAEELPGEATAETKGEKNAKVSDRFAKFSAREELEPGEYGRELKHQLSINAEFEAAFEKLGEGVKSGYLMYFSGPKLTASITNRIVKKIERIINGHGLNDCICGRSKNAPNCDGSHKNASSTSVLDKIPVL